MSTNDSGAEWFPVVPDDVMPVTDDEGKITGWSDGISRAHVGRASDEAQVIPSTGEWYPAVPETTEMLLSKSALLWSDGLSRVWRRPDGDWKPIVSEHAIELVNSVTGEVVGAPTSVADRAVGRARPAVAVEQEANLIVDEAFEIKPIVQEAKPSSSWSMSSDGRELTGWFHTRRDGVYPTISGVYKTSSATPPDEHGDIEFKLGYSYWHNSTRCWGPQFETPDQAEINHGTYLIRASHLDAPGAWRGLASAPVVDEY